MSTDYNRALDHAIQKVRERKELYVAGNGGLTFTEAKALQYVMDQVIDDLKELKIK